MMSLSIVDGIYIRGECVVLCFVASPPRTESSPEEFDVDDEFVDGRLHLFACLGPMRFK